ncbi:hypothetical protein [Streptomyces bluensis]|uniref:Integral membrane protein n=1 Tax=Streptomyces bluensis TaxID=33897 RepID=A0ABW6UU17_9ACTN
MSKHVMPIREQVRGVFLALLGVTAAWTVSLPLAGFGFWWQVLAGAAVFLATSATAGRRLFRLTREQAVAVALILLVLTRGMPRHA